MLRHTGPTPAVRQTVIDRSRGACVRCGRHGEQIHHRKPRQMGGSRDQAINAPANLVLLCANCHAWIESHRTDAYNTGWLVHRADDPAEQPVIDNWGRTRWLD